MNAQKANEKWQITWIKLVFEKQKQLKGHKKIYEWIYIAIPSSFPY
jgi:hypothetical protein